MASNHLRYARALYLALLLSFYGAVLAGPVVDQKLHTPSLHPLVSRDISLPDTAPSRAESPHHAIEQGPFAAYKGAIRAVHPSSGGKTLAQSLGPADGLAQFDAAGRQTQLENLHDTLRKGRAGQLAARPPDVPRLVDRVWTAGLGSGARRQPSGPHEGKPVAAFFGLQHEARLIREYGLTRAEMAYVAGGASPQARECRAQHAQCSRRGARACVGVAAGAMLGCAVYLSTMPSH